MDWSVTLINWDKTWEAAGPFIISFIALFSSFIIVVPVLGFVIRRSASRMVKPAVILCIG